MVAKQIIEKLQSFLTEEEAKRIIPQYKKNYDPDFGDVYEESSASEIIFDGFAWDESPQGERYWDTIYLRIKDREENGKTD